MVPYHQLFFLDFVLQLLHSVYLKYFAEVKVYEHLIGSEDCCIQTPHTAIFYEFRKRLMIMLIAYATTCMMLYLNIKTIARAHPKARGTYSFGVSRQRAPFTWTMCVFIFFRCTLMFFFSFYAFAIIFFSFSRVRSTRLRNIYHFNYRTCPTSYRVFGIASILNQRVCDSKGDAME